MIEKEQKFASRRWIRRIRVVTVHTKLEHCVVQFNRLQILGHIGTVDDGDIFAGRCVCRCTQNHFLTQFIQCERNAGIVNGILADHIVNAIELIGSRFIDIFTLWHIVEHVLDGDLSALIASAWLWWCLQVATCVGCSTMSSLSLLYDVMSMYICTQYSLVSALFRRRFRLNAQMRDMADTTQCLTTKTKRRNRGKIFEIL